MSSNFTALEYPRSDAPKTDKLSVDSSTESVAEEPQEVVSIITASELEDPQVKTWELHNLIHEIDPITQENERAAYSEIEKKLQPEITRQTEVLKKEAYEGAKAKGFDAGYSDGKVLGQQEAKDIALAESEARLTEKMASLDALLASLNDPYKLIETQVFEHLSSLALHIAEEVVQQKITGNSEWIMQTIHQAIEVLNDDLMPLEITLNPADFELVNSLQTGFSEHWSTKSDEKVEQGTCQVKQGYASIEHNWKERFENMSLKLQAQAAVEEKVE